MFKKAIEKSACALAAVALSVSAGATQELSEREQKSLDEQVQEVKSDVLDIAAELSLLEEKLLYPSNTQVSIFLSMLEEEPFRLDAVRIAIDGELVAHYIYSYKELEALQQGGVQRIYTGNIPTGEHSIEVSVAGKSKEGREYSHSQTFSFDKDVEPELIGITLAGSGPSAIQLGNW